MPDAPRAPEHPPHPPAHEAPSPGGPRPKGDAHPGVWVSTSYFAEGFPYTVVNTLAEVLWKEMGASLEAIGLTSLFHLPWNIKFLWGPFLDSYETKRRWLIGIEVALTVVMVLLALVSPLPFVLPAAAVLFTLLAFLAATHDIAIDGYYLEALDKDGQSRYVGLRAGAYRMAMFAVSGPMIFLIGRFGWVPGFLATAAIMAALLVFHRLRLPRAEARKRPISELVRGSLKPRTLAIAATLVALVFGGRTYLGSAHWGGIWEGIVAAAPFLGTISSSGWIGIALLMALIAILAALGPIKRAFGRSDGVYLAAFVNFLEQPKVGKILAFIILFRTGESFLLKMKYAFMREIGMTVEQYGLFSGTLGLWASITATLIGGWLIGRHGLKAWIWPFVIAQNVLNLLFMGVSSLHDAQVAVGGPGVPLEVMGAAITLEAIGSGLGTAVFMVYIMRCCRPNYKAAHMAILTALMSLSFTIAGVMSGFLAERLGFTTYFGLTFLATLPGMALIFFVPYLDGTSAADLGDDPPQGSAPSPQGG